MTCRVLISDKMDPKATTIFRERGIEDDEKPGLTPEELKAIIGEYDGLAIRSATKVTRALLEAAENLKVVGRARRGIYLSDGTINVALLKIEPHEGEPRLYHFGVWVDDLEEAEKKAQAAGATYLAGRPTSPNSFYECKYKDPNGIVFDLTHNGWVGAVKDVVPAKETADA